MSESETSGRGLGGGGEKHPTAAPEKKKQEKQIGELTRSSGGSLEDFQPGSWKRGGLSSELYLSKEKTWRRGRCKK